MSVGFQAPMLNRAQHTSENTPQVVWNGWLRTGLPHLKLTTAGQYSTRDDVPFFSESKANVGLCYDLNRTWSVYTFAEDRFRVDEWRYVAGVRLNLGG